MNTTSKLIAITVIGILLIAGMLPSIQSLQIDTNDEDEHPEYYEVIRYNMRGLTYDKETIEVSYEEAMAIKQQLEHIESLPDTTERNRRRNDLFFNNDLLSEKRDDQFSDLVQFIFDLDSNQRNYGESFNLLIANIKGTLGPSYINLFHFIFFAPVFLSLARGVDIQLTSLFDSYHFQTENMVSIFAVIMVGTILVLPLISPNGYINADVILGSITELE